MCIHGMVAVDLTNNLNYQTRETHQNHPLPYILIIVTKNYIQYSFQFSQTIEQWNNWNWFPAAVAASASLDASKKGIYSLTH